MNTHTVKSILVPLLIAGFAVALLGPVAAAIEPVIGWLHSPFEGLEEVFALEQLPEALAAPLRIAPAVPGQTRRKARCEECGVIDSIRRVAAVDNLPEFYEITIRLGDGSMHVVADASLPNWRPGARIKFIDGGNGPGE